MRPEHSRPFLPIAFAKRMVSKRADSPARALSYVHAEPYVKTHRAVHV